ncbi:MAG: cation:proton antiporter [archaeon]
MAEIEALSLFIHIAEIVIAAAIVTLLLRRFKQPTHFTYIVAGILIGPLVLGGMHIVLGGSKIMLGIPEITPEITLLSTLGTAFLLFSIGIETNLKRLMNIGKTVLIGTVLQVIIVIAVTYLLTVPLGLLSGDQAIFIGVIVAFSSTMIVVKLLSDKNEINTLGGRIMISILLLQDFLVVFFYPILANISTINDPLVFGVILFKSIVLVFIALIANKFVFPKLFEIAAEEQEIFFLSSIATAFIFIGISFLLEIPIPIGAFIGGLALSTLPYNSEIFSKVRALRDFFLTIFFVALGAQLSFSFGNVPLALMIIITLIIFLIKPIVLFAITLLGGYGSRMGVRVGISLGQVSEFGFELAGIGAVTLTAAGTAVLPKDLFSFLITIIAVSMIVTPYLANSSSRIAQWFYGEVEHLPKSMRRKYFSRKLLEIEAIPSKRALKDHIVIVGGGTVGRGLAKELIRSHQVMIIDHDPEVVKQGVKDGLPYVYGTSESTALLDRLDLKQAKLLVITILDHREALRMVAAVKNIAPHLTIFATAHYFSDTSDLYKHKVDFVAMPSIMGGNVFLENISAFLEKGKLSSLNNFRSEYLSYLDDQVKEENRYKRR